jgi:tetratricopeptide (TPR) repeat protein
VPLLRPVAAAVLLLAVLVPLTLGLFHFSYRDELFLARLAGASVPLTAEQTNRLKSIFRQTIESRYPSDDRLVLLENALLHADMRSEVVQVTRVLAKRDLSNLGLQLAYAQALDDMGEPDAGLLEYQRLLGRIDKGDFPAERRTAVLLAAARTAVHASQLDQAITWFQEVLANSPPNGVEVRDELAGVLLSANRPQEVIALFAQPPQDWEGAMLLAKARLLVGDYAGAEWDMVELLKRRPRDLDANLLLLDAYARQGNMVQARALASSLIEENPESPVARIRAGQTALAVEQYRAALLLFQGLLQGGTELGTSEPVVQRGFIDAAASIQTLEPIDPAVVKKVAGAAQGGWLAKDIPYLERLAWVSQRLTNYDLATDLLRHVVELEPESEGARQRYVGVLLAAGRGPDAARFLEGLPDSREARYLLMDVYLHDRNYDAVERIANAKLKINPLNYYARIALIEAALAQKDFARAQELLATLHAVPPQKLEQRARWANAELWAGNGATALAIYRSLLEEAPKRKDLWIGYINAAAATPELTGADAKLIRPVAEQFARDSDDVILLSRLAWVLYRLKETALFEQVLDRAQALKPTDPAARKELAGMLGAAGRFKEALALYEGLPLDAEDRRRLGHLYEAAQDFAGAAAQYRLILEKQPDDQETRERLGLVLSWNKDFREAAAVYEQLAAAQPSNPAWAARAAELKLWSGDAPGALAAYTQVLDPDPRQPNLWRGFVDAAGQVPQLDAAQARLAKRIGLEVLAGPPEIIPQLGASTVGLLASPLGKGPLLAASNLAPKGPERDPLFLSRLAWVLVKAGATADAEAVLERADALHPKDPAVVKELAGVFGAVGRFQRAIALFRGLDLSFADRLRLVQFYNGDHDFVSAETELRKLLKLRPGDREVEMMLADVLAWQGKPEASAALLQQLRKADPESKELTRRLAQVELWAHNYSASVELFGRLLDGNPNQPELWGDFVAAAAAAPSLDSRYRKLLMGLADKALADPPKDAPFLSRLAQSVRTLKEPDKAADLLLLAIKIDPDSRPITLQLAQTLYDAGRLEEAKRYFTAVLPGADRGR